MRHSDIATTLKCLAEQPDDQIRTTINSMFAGMFPVSASPQEIKGVGENMTIEQIHEHLRLADKYARAASRFQRRRSKGKQPPPTINLYVRLSDQARHERSIARYHANTLKLDFNTVVTEYMRRNSQRVTALR